MVSRSAVINKLRELNYSYKEQLKRTYVYKKDGGTQRVFVPMRDLIADEWVMSQFQQIGMTEDEVKRFIGMCKV